MTCFTWSFWLQLTPSDCDFPYQLAVRHPRHHCFANNATYHWLFVLPISCTVQFLHHEGYLRAAGQRNNRAAFDKGYPGILRNEGNLYSDNRWLQNIHHEMDVRLLQYNRRTQFSL
jgi:hypothetical protein